MRRTILATVVASFAMTGASAGEAETIPQRLMVDLQEDFDFEDFQAAGVVGNLARETGNFRYLQEIDPLVEGSRGGIGYAQWTGPRRDDYEAWAGDADLTAYETNYGFLVEELSGAYARVVTKVLETETAEEAARVFMERFLIPHPSYQHLDERIAYAEAYLEGDFSGAGCQSHHEVETSGRMMIVSMCPKPYVAPDDTLGVVFASADIDDLRPDDGEVEVITAEMLNASVPLRSYRLLVFPDLHDADDLVLHTGLLMKDGIDVTAWMDEGTSARDILFDILESP